MHTHLLKGIALALTLTTTLTSYGEDTPPEQIIPIGTKTGNRKKIPAIHRSFITYSSPEACLSTTMPYTYAVVEAADQDGNVYSSMVVTPEESCGYLLLQPSSTITVTFDNGVTLQGEN